MQTPSEQSFVGYNITVDTLPTLKPKTMYIFACEKGVERKKYKKRGST